MACRCEKPKDIVPAQFGSWLSDIFHQSPILGSVLGPSGHEKLQMQTDADQVAAINDLNARITALQQGTVTAPQNVTVALGSGMDNFISQNKMILIAGGAGLIALLALKKKV